MHIPRRIITTWICDPERDRFTDRHRDICDACIRSWLKVMPDYDIRIVTLGNLFEFEHDPWIEARVAEGNWIGASQWARLSYLKHLGGIFFDADVEAIRRFDPLLPDHGVFHVGHLGNGQTFANNAIMVCRPQHPFLDVLMQGIQRQDPRNPEFGNLTGPFLLSSILRAAGWDGQDRNALVTVGGDEIAVHRSAVFHPYNWNQHFDRAVHVQPDTLAVHHWASSWRPAEKQTTQNWR